MYKMLNLHVLLYGWMNFTGCSCTQFRMIHQQIPCRKFQRNTMGRLSFANRNRVIGLLQVGSLKRHVARLVNCSRQTIQSLSGARLGGSSQIRPSACNYAQSEPFYPVAACATSMYASDENSEEHCGHSQPPH